MMEKEVYNKQEQRKNVKERAKQHLAKNTVGASNIILTEFPNLLEQNIKDSLTVLEILKVNSIIRDQYLYQLLLLILDHHIKKAKASLLEIEVEIEQIKLPDDYFALAKKYRIQNILTHTLNQA